MVPIIIKYSRDYRFMDSGMAIDLNGFGKKENIMWIVEQIPGETMKKDVTSYLYEDVMIVNGSDR